MKKILIINGHPDKESLCTEFAKSYKAGAEKSSADCTLINLIDLNFDPILYYGYRKRTELEPDLLKVQQDILNADHLVFVYPTWWGTYPALLKGFIDRVFLPKFAFEFYPITPISCFSFIRKSFITGTLCSLINYRLKIKYTGPQAFYPTTIFCQRRFGYPTL
jgi:multimeric flavodoxin WrbA